MQAQLKIATIILMIRLVLSTHHTAIHAAFDLQGWRKRTSKYRSTNRTGPSQCQASASSLSRPRSPALPTSTSTSLNAALASSRARSPCQRAWTRSSSLPSALKWPCGPESFWCKQITVFCCFSSLDELQQSIHHGLQVEKPFSSTYTTCAIAVQ